MSRPSTFSNESACQIAWAIRSLGASVRVASARVGRPESTVRSWSSHRPEVRSLFAAAHLARLADRLEEVGFDLPRGWECIRANLDDALRAEDPDDRASCVAIVHEFLTDPKWMDVAPQDAAALSEHARALHDDFLEARPR